MYYSGPPDGGEDWWGLWARWFILSL